VIVRGLDNSEASKAIIARGLPAKGIPLWNAKEGGWVVSKKHEAKMRDVIAALASESITQKPQETAQNEGKTGAESNTPSPAENAKNVQAQIDADFAANREAMGKFNPGDKVEWDHANFYRDGRSRTFTGTVDKVQSAEQGTIRVISDTGGDVTAGARTLRHAANQEPAPQKTATPAAEPAPESKADQKGYGTQNKLFTADAAEKGPRASARKDEPVECRLRPRDCAGWPYPDGVSHRGGRPVFYGCRPRSGFRSGHDAH
jgi:hypothetical protein